MRAMIKCKCKDVINVLTMMLSLLKAGRKLVGFHCLGHSSPEETLKKCSSGNGYRDLVVSYALVKGSQNPSIINTTKHLSVLSRSSSKLINLYPNTFLDMMVVYEKVLKNNHKCDELLSLLFGEHLAETINFSLSDLLGEF